MCVPVRNLKDLTWEEMERSWEYGGKKRRNDRTLLCVDVSLCAEVCLWVVGNVGELNILAVTFQQGKGESMKCVRCSVWGWWL